MADPPMPARERLAQFHALYRAHFGLLWSVTGQFGLSAAEREDAVQDVWLAAYRRLHTLDPSASPKAWLCSIARRIAWRHRRTAMRARRRRAVIGREPQAEVPRPDRLYAAAARAREALAGLGAAQRLVLVLSHVHGLTAPEIATALSIPLNTVYSRLRLARAHVDRVAHEHGALDGDAPPPNTERRMWAVLVLRLSDPSATVLLAAPTGIGTLKSIALGMVAGAAIWAGILTATEAPIGPPPAAEPASVELPTRPSPPALIQAAAVGRATAVDVPAAHEPAPAPAPDSVHSTPTPVAERATATPVRRTHATVREHAPPAHEDDAGLEAEAALLHRAQASLRAGEALAALRLLEEHEDRFPHGHLGDARTGAMVRTLCALGRDAEARRHADRLRREYPGSLVTAKVGGDCRGE